MEATNRITLTVALLDAMRDFVCKNMAYARYKAGDVWHESEITEKQVLEDGRIAVSFMIDHAATGNETVTEISLHNYSGVAWATKDVSISRPNATEGILCRCRFNVVEDTEEGGMTNGL